MARSAKEPRNRVLCCEIFEIQRIIGRPRPSTPRCGNPVRSGQITDADEISAPGRYSSVSGLGDTGSIRTNAAIGYSVFMPPPAAAVGVRNSPEKWSVTWGKPIPMTYCQGWIISWEAGERIQGDSA